MKKLNELQNIFIDDLYENKKNSFCFIKDRKAKKESLIGIYQNNLFGTLVEALKITYKKTLENLGENDFKDIATEFAKKHRSKSGNLDNYGAEFPNFLKNNLENGDFLHDLARIDWLRQESYLAEDEDNFDIAALQKLDQEKLADVKFELSASCFLLKSDYDLFNEKVRKKTSYYVIFRQFMNVFDEKIDEEEYNFLLGVKKNLTLFEIYEKYACDIEKNLQKYVGNQVLKSFAI